MSFLRNFKDDLFISYSSTDDQDLFGLKEGWVTRFHDQLQKVLRAELGSRNATIWKDKRELHVGNELTPTLIDQLGQTGLLLTVISPPFFFDTDWCVREFRIFCEKAEQNGGLRVRNDAGVVMRIIKVVKKPVERRLQPAEMRDLIQFDFYEKRPDGTTLAYDFDYTPRQQYAWQMTTLAQHIADILTALSGGPRVEPPRATVYLAEVPPDLRREREEIRQDLIRRGFAVLPDVTLWPEESNFKDKVRDFLARSSVSIHLIGQEYGAVPSGETKSQTAVEAALAGERCADPGFRRVLWMPLELKTSDLRQEEFVGFLQNDSSANQQTDLLQTKLEDLKTFLFKDLFSRKDKLASQIKSGPGAETDTPLAAAPEAAAKPAVVAAPRIYIVADQHDIDSGAVKPLDDYLYSQEYETTVSEFGEDDAEARRLHLQHLQLDDACVIFYGKSSSLWLDAKRNELHEAMALRKVPMRALVIFIAGPDTGHKQRFRTREAIVIRSLEEFDPGKVAPLLEVLKRAQH